MTLTVLRAAPCALCQIDGEADELYPATVAPEDFRVDTFSARRRPDRVHYRIVRCRRCRLVRSDPVADPELVASLYRSSSFDYEPEVPNLVRTYGRYLAKIARSHRNARFLEVGCGNGFMLAEARRQDFATVTGIEPSREAVERSDPAERPFLICDTLRPGVVEPGQIDVVCFFQVFDHLSDPGGALDVCWNALKPGGCLLLFNHNVSALSARVLRHRSPIIDVEHTYLYDPATLASLCGAKGFIVERRGSAWNWCSLGYLTRLLPLPERVKDRALRVLASSRLGSVNLFLPLGNLYLIARKPFRPTDE